MRLFPVGPKIYPKYNNNDSNIQRKMGNEIRTTEESKKILVGFNNKYTGYKDASQLIREIASKQVSKQMQNTDPNKDNSINEIRSALRRNRNAGSSVPKKVTNKKYCSYN